MPFHFPRFIFYGGKGGVGKTTCAAARAVAEAAAGARVLVVSTDPAHSLGDVLGVKLSRAPRAVRRRLYAAELDAPRAFARWLNEHRAALSDVLEHGTWLDRADVAALLDLTIPGVDELVGLQEIARLARLDSPERERGRSSAYDTVVVDTAPTGHALRLLAAPETVTAVAGVLDALQEEHRIVRQQFARVVRPEAADRLIALMTRQAADIARVLRDSRRTSFHWVTLPEPLSIAETEDGVAALTNIGIRVADIIVNRVLPPGDPCPICDRRRAGERTSLAHVRRALGRGRAVRVIAAQIDEPRGVKALARLRAATLFTTGSTKDMEAWSLSRRGSRRRVLRDLPRGAATLVPESLAAVRGAQLIFVGGKGGVGKTTVAAALAVRLARAMPDDAVLLLSTDPAHSLADVLDAPVGDEPAAVRDAPANLVVRELDAARALQAKRAALQAALDEVTGSLGAATASAEQLMDLAPPGIDELFGMLTVVDARASHGAIVVDTAPTGHALRLLEMPDAAREWVQALLRVLLKYTSLVRPGRLAAELVEASQSIRELRGVLRDPALTRFLVVTRAAAVPRAETERLVRRLRALKLATPALVMNARTLAPGACRRCRATDAAERRELAALTRFARGARLRDCAIIQAPLVAPPPRGASVLDRWAQTWIASES